MGAKTSISWTHIIPNSHGATWNPIRAKNLENGRDGYICTKVSPGCDNCYASLINMTQDIGNGLEYPPIADSRKLDGRVKIWISQDDSSQTSIDWPLRANKSRGIFVVSMSDWLGEFLHTETATWILAVMLLAQNHIFITSTKRPKHLRNLVLSLAQESIHGIMVPNEKIYDIAILRLRGVLDKMKWEGRHALKIYNGRYQAAAPWAPSNIYFGVSVCTVQEAISYKKYFEEIKQLVPHIKLWISQEPALEVIDWEAIGYTKKHFDWLVWGGESGYKARRAHEEGVVKAIEFGKSQGIPVFVKQMGTVIGLEWDIDTKGDHIPLTHPYFVRQFPDIEGCYFPWK